MNVFSWLLSCFPCFFLSLVLWAFFIDSLFSQGFQCGGISTFVCWEIVFPASFLLLSQDFFSFNEIIGINCGPWAEIAGFRVAAFVDI